MPKKQPDPAVIYPSTADVLKAHGQEMTLREAVIGIAKRNPFLRLFGPGCGMGGEPPWNLLVRPSGLIDTIGGLKPNEPAVIVFDPPAQPAGMPWAFEGLLSAGGKVWAIGPRLGVCPRDEYGKPLLGAEYEAAVAAHTATVYDTAEGDQGDQPEGDRAEGDQPCESA